MNIKEILKDSIELLKINNITDPSLKAKILLSFVLNINKEYLTINDNKEINEKDIKKYDEYINRLLNNEPLQYIIGLQEFMKLKFIVNKDVLIPRQDTEILVEEVIEKAKQIPNCKILDLCTGSGAIAISLKTYVPDSIIMASDISIKAVKTAKDNAKLNNVKIKIIKSDLFDKIGNNKKFDIIVSNPPYIEENVIKTLDKEVQQEPEIALNGGQDGLDFYRKIIETGYRYLNVNGFVCFEIGYNQKEDIIKIINENNKYKNVYSKKDLYGNDRIIICTKR